ncbi:hypothetical protein PMAYCL1PPCAC_09611, partial [Pristionchus mayeri]
MCGIWLKDNGSIERMRDGKRYMHCLWDDPNRDGILIDFSDTNLEYFCPNGVHRGKAIYSNTLDLPEPSRPKAYMLSENAIVFESKKWHPYVYYSTEDSPFVYVWIADDEHIYVLETNTMRFLAPLKLRGFSTIWKIAGVHNGVITARCYRDGRYYVVTAQLPDEYFSSAKGEFESE